MISAIQNRSRVIFEIHLLFPLFIQYLLKFDFYPEITLTVFVFFLSLTRQINDQSLSLTYQFNDHNAQQVGWKYAEEAFKLQWIDNGWNDDDDDDGEEEEEKCLDLFG